MVSEIGAPLFIQGPKGSLEIKAEDKLMRKLAMLIEVNCFGKNLSEVCLLYGYKKQRYYQILNNYKASGSMGIIEQKKGPKKNGKRTDSVVSQIIRYKFLDPAISGRVILQKLTQRGIPIGLRSVERTIAEYGLQKKTLRVESGKRKGRT